MAVQTKNELTKEKSTGKKKHSKRQDEEKFSKHLAHEFHTLLIMLVLKYYSKKENPLSITELHEILMSISPVGDQKTTSRKLKDLENILSANEQFPDSEFICSAPDLLRLVFCGSLHKYDSPTKKGIAKYYFEPVLDAAHIDMLKGSIISNQYLSDSERSLLLSAISTLDALPLSNENGAISSISDDPLAQLCNLAPSHLEASQNRDYSLLQNITLLYEAILGGWKIQMLQGSYQKNSKDKKIELVPTHPEKPYHLNPYALFFQNGHQYLLATKEGDTQPWHFRVDRICTVALLRDPKHPKAYAKREPVPEPLQIYYKDKQLRVFDETTYSQAHPLMAIYTKKNLISCTLEGGSAALSVMADSFGKENIRIQSEKEIEDSAGKKKKLFTFKIRAQKEALELLCSQQHMLLTVLEPASLIDTVKNNLQSSLNQYNQAP